MLDFYIGQGDTLPYLEGTLSYDDGSPINLTDAVVELQAELACDVSVKIERAVTVLNALAGTVRFRFTAEETAVFGHYKGKWRAYYEPDDSPMTIPNCNNFNIYVTRSYV